MRWEKPPLHIMQLPGIVSFAFPFVSVVFVLVWITKMEEGQLLLDNHHPVAGFRRLLSKVEKLWERWESVNFW